MMLMNVWETKTSKSYYNFDKMISSSWAKKRNRKIKNLHVWYDWNPERRPPKSRALWEKVARMSDWSAIFANTQYYYQTHGSLTSGTIFFFSKLFSTSVNSFLLIELSRNLYRLCSRWWTRSKRTVSNLLFQGLFALITTIYATQCNNLDNSDLTLHSPKLS